MPGRRTDYLPVKPAADASTRLAEALLQSEMLKSSPHSLLIRRPADRFERRVRRAAEN